MATQAAETRIIDQIDTITSGWDARVDSNNTRIAEMVKTWAITLKTQGDISTPSVIRIETRAMDGGALSASARRQNVIRILIADGADGWDPSPNAFISAVGVGTKVRDLVPSPNPNTEVLIESNSTGVIEFDVTDATAEFITIRLGPPPVGGSSGNHTGHLVVQHS